MKELKFRAWWKDTKRFLDGDEWYMTCSGAKHLHYSTCPYSDDDFIVEQYTGIKDKNGKEIYEGDIVEYDWYIIGDKPAYRTKEQVVFDDIGARLDTDRIRFCTNVEVIGNIHENADLLGEK